MSQVSRSTDSCKVSPSPADLQALPPVAVRLQKKSDRGTSEFSNSQVPQIVQGSPVADQKIDFCSSSEMKARSVRSSRSSSSSTDSNSISTEGTYLYMEMRTALLE